MYCFCFEVGLDEFPVDEGAEGFDVFGPSVAIVDVVGVLPYVESQQGLVALSERVACVGGVEDAEFFVLADEPGPA